MHFYIFRSLKTTPIIHCKLRMTSRSCNNSEIIDGSKNADKLKADIVINTYPDLQPFLEMAVLFEGIYEHAQSQSNLTSDT